MMTKGAIGNLINRYRAVLKKCHLLNVFGSLAIASMMVMGCPGTADATMEGFSSVPWEELKKEIDITAWVDGAEVEVTSFKEPGKSIIFGGSMVLATDYTSEGGLAPSEKNYVHIDKSTINVTGGKSDIDWVTFQLNAGGTAIGEGAKSSVGTSEITISGPVELRTRYDEWTENGVTFTEPIYTPIRGGGCSVNGGYTNVDTSIINIDADPGMRLEVSDIMGGGCVVSGGEEGEAYTRNTIININDLADRNMVRQGEHNGYTRIFGGGDMAEVRNAEINLNNCSVDQLQIFGGGYAEEDGRPTITGTSSINITGSKLHYTWENNKNGMPVGDVVAGGYSKGQGVTSVEHTDIVIKDGEMRSRISGGGYAENGGIAYVSSSNVLITDNAIMNGDGARGRADIFGGGYASNGGITQTGSSKLTITGGAVVKGQVFSGGWATGKGSKTTVADTTVIVDNGVIQSTYRPLGGYNGEELRAGRLSGGVITNDKAEGGVEHSTVIFRNSVLEGARILGGSSAQDGSKVSDGTTNVYIESGVIKPSFDKNTNRFRARLFNAGGDCWQGGESYIDTANMYISGGEVQCNVYAGSDTEDDDFSLGKSYAEVKNANLHITGGKFNLDYIESISDKELEQLNHRVAVVRNLVISAGGDAYDGPTSKVENSTLVIDGSSGNLSFDKGELGRGFWILAGGYAETSQNGLHDNEENWARAHVENSKVLLKDIDSKNGKDLKVYAGGAGFTAHSTVTNSDLTLDNVTVRYIDPFIRDKSNGGPLAVCSVENSTVTLINDTKILDKILIEAGKSVLAVDSSFMDEKTNEGIKIRADQRVLRLLNDVKTFDMNMLDGDKWNYQAFTRSKEAIHDFKLTRLETMGQTELSTNGFKGITDATIGGEGNTLQIGGSGEFVAETVTLSQNKLSLKEGTLAAENIHLINNGHIKVDGGSLKTSSGQIFAQALDSNGKNAETGGIKTELSGKLTFKSGNLALTDKKYNKAYAAKALSNIRDTVGGSTANVIMLGKLMVESNADGSVDFEGGGNHGNHGSIDIADTKPGNGYGDKNHVHVHWKNQLGLLGGDNTDCQLITANNGGDIVLEVGNASEVQTLSAETEKGVVTLGNEFHASKGTLSGTVQVNTGAQLAVVENGEYIVKDIELKGADAEADVKGKLTTESISSTGGILKVSGEATSGSVKASGSALDISGKLNTGSLVADNTSTAVGGSVEASSLTAKAGSISVGDEAAAGRLTVGELSADGTDISVTERSSVKADKLSTSSGKLAISGTLSSAEMQTLDSDVSIDGSVETEKLVADAATVISVGDQDTAGRLTVGEADLNGAAVFLDPAWDSDPSKNIIENASHAVFAGTEVSGRLTAGQNSLLVLGDDDAEAAIAAFKASGRGWKSETEAAIAIMKPQTLTGTGSLLANGKLTTTSPDADKFAASGTAVFKEGSLLMVDASAAASGAALTGNGGKLTVESGAQLYLHDAQAGVNYVLVDGFSADSSIEGWKDADLILNRAVTGDFTFKDGAWGILPEKNDLTKEFPELLAQNALAALVVDSSSDVMGVRFLSNALNPTILSDEDFVDVTNEVTRAAVTAGVQNTALRLADAASNTVLDHLSLAGHTASVHADGADFWAAPLYGNLYTSGMVTGGSSVRGQFGGLALGADLEAGRFLGGTFRVGASINGGGGQSETKGTATVTENDYDFGGLNVYAGWNNGALNVIGSVGYGFGNHEVEMGLPSSMDFGKAKADVDTTVLTADLRAEYQLNTAWVDVLPHIGVRYTALRTDSHELKVDGGVLNSVERTTQNIVQFPIGVTLSKDFAFADWSVKPTIDLSFIPAAGDTKADTKVKFSGLDAWDGVHSRIMDDTSWAGTVGVQAEKGNLSFGLNYGVQASSHETDQNVQVKFGWKF